MSKTKIRKAAFAAAAGILPIATTATAAAVLGPHAEDCAPGADKPAMLVHVEGLHKRAGQLRIQAYGGSTESYFEKGAYIERVDLDVPASGSVEVCMPVPKAGLYAIAVKHSVGSDDTFSLANGGGFSGNPPVGIMDVLLKRKPSPARVQIAVRGLTHVPVTVRYLENAL